MILFFEKKDLLYPKMIDIIMRKLTYEGIGKGDYAGRKQYYEIF